MKKTVATTLLLLSTSAVFANSDAPIAACTGYLQSSKSEFKALISKNQATAKKVADALTACQKANACSVINGVPNCAAELPSRAFASTFYANYQGASTKVTVSSKPTTKKAAAPVNNNHPQQSNNTNDDSYLSISPLNKVQKESKDSESINWF